MSTQTGPRTATEPELTGAEPADPRAESTVSQLRRSTAAAMFLVVIALFVIFSVISPNHAFFQLDNFKNLSLESAQIVLLAVGMTFVLSCGELDLSIGANVILSSVVGAKVMGRFTDASLMFAHPLAAGLVGLVGALAVGTIAGLLNGLVVTRLRINSFIVTLATTGLFTGVAYIISNGADISTLPPELQTNFGIATFAGIPVPAVIAILAIVVGTIVLRYTRFGIKTLAIGSSKTSAERAGIRVDRHRLVLFVMMGFVAGLVGYIDLSRFLITNIAGHQTDALAAISAVVIGGTSLFGGAGSVPGAVVGALIPAILNNGLIIMKVETFYQLVAVAIILLIAVYIDQRRRSRST